MDPTLTNGTNPTDTVTGPIYSGDIAVPTHKDIPDCETCIYKIGAMRPTLKTMQPKTDDVEDPWIHRREGMKCKTCMWHVNCRCRRHAPTMQGYHAVFPDDWCGDHKLDKVQMGGV